MALAGEQHGVTGVRALEGGSDRSAAIGDEEQAAIALRPGCLGSGGDGLQDGVAILASRILVGHDDQAASLGGDPSHQRSLGDVALTRRPEHRDDASTRAAATGASRSSTVWSEAGLWA